MNKLEEVIKMITDKAKEEFGEDYKLQEGDEFASVFNDGVILLGVENSQLTMKVLAGEPYRFDYNLDLLEKEQNQTNNLL